MGLRWGVAGVVSAIPLVGFVSFLLPALGFDEEKDEDDAARLKLLSAVFAVASLSQGLNLGNQASNTRLTSAIAVKPYFCMRYPNKSVQYFCLKDGRVERHTYSRTDCTGGGTIYVFQDGACADDDGSFTQMTCKGATFPPTTAGSTRTFVSLFAILFIVTIFC